LSGLQLIALPMLTAGTNSWKGGWAMILRPFFAVALMMLCYLNTSVAAEHLFPKQIGGSTVSWNDNRLTVEFNNSPVKGVLKGLMESGGSGCQISGDLQGTINFRIDNLTVEDAILKIMRNNNYDYTIISAEAESPPDPYVSVSELTIYQNDKVVRFVRVPKGEATIQPRRVDPLPIPAAKPPDEQPVPASVAGGEEIEKLDSEIKSLMDEMLTEGKMSQQEYDEALKSISGEK
jgi:hypothetical protein